MTQPTGEATLAVYKFAQGLLRDPNTPQGYAAVIDKHKDAAIDFVARMQFERNKGREL